MKNNDIAVFNPSHLENEGAGTFASILLMAGAFSMTMGVSALFFGEFMFSALLIGIPLIVLGLPAYMISTHISWDMDGKQTSLLKRYKELCKEMGKEELPMISTDMILNMEGQDASEVKNKLDNLHQAWLENQKAIKVRDFRIDEVKADLKDRAESLNASTKYMKELQ